MTDNKGFCTKGWNPKAPLHCDNARCTRCYPIRDTINRLYLLDLNNILEPTRYASDDNKDAKEFLDEIFNDKGVYYTLGELYSFDKTIQIRDIDKDEEEKE